MLIYKKNFKESKNINNMFQIDIKIYKAIFTIPPTNAQKLRKKKSEIQKMTPLITPNKIFIIFLIILKTLAFKINKITILDQKVNSKVPLHRF